MIPPRSFVSSVYCASPGASLSRSFESEALQQLVRARPFDLDLAHVRDVEDARIRADGAVLRDHALVLDRHLPAGERHHPRAERDMPIVQRRLLQRLRHRSGDPSDLRPETAPEEPPRCQRAGTGAADRVVGLALYGPTL